ncbi:hypothetical protein [Falsirhodobacter xinxiangensis]|uniref:hypothetical protein n=1 Tax=Falsirhodobacter xinxiangensis TaxID=2530049 RepID=UPI0010AA0051|nr:hypothetical protein [Rhodobacter xinxiangensis]
MIDMEKLGRAFFAARFTLDVGCERVALDERIPDEDADEFMEALDAATSQFKTISDSIAKENEAFCSGYIAANREALAAGKKWSDERAEKVALLRLSGDDTPEDQIPL